MRKRLATVSDSGYLEQDLEVSKVKMEDESELRTYLDIIRNAPEYGPNVAAIGDSICLGGNVQTSVGLFLKPNWVNMSLWQAKNNFKHIYNGGVSGDKTDQILARIDDEILPKKPHMCYVNGGTNDIGANYSVATIAGNMEEIIKKLLKARILPLIVSVLPQSDSGLRTTILNINLAYMKLCEKYKIPYINVHDCLLDPTTGLGKTEYFGDGVHPNITGHKVMADYIVSHYFNKMPEFYSFMAASNEAVANLVDNGCFLGGVTGGIPNSWQANGGTANITLVADAENVVGNWVQIERTDTVAHNFYWGMYTDETLAVGDKVNFSGKFKMDTDATAEVTILVSFGGSSYVVQPVSTYNLDVAYGQFSMDFTVPEGATSMSATLLTEKGLCTVSLGQMTMRNLTKLGLV